MSLNVLVLGAGPAGMVAAYTAARLGINLAIMSKGELGKAVKSELHGCQYLHAPLRFMQDALPVTVNYQLEGTSEGYRQKVYGHTGITPENVSPDEYGPQGTHSAWDLRAAYDRLWETFNRFIYAIDEPLNPLTMQAVATDTRWDVILNTIPADVICGRQEHFFASTPVWAVGQRHSSQQEAIVTRSGEVQNQFSCPENTVLCNGEQDVGWYRKARVFGQTTVEWPYREGKRKPPFAGVVRVDKPVATNCDCWLDGGKVVRLGRFGKWQKGYLVHQVAEETEKALAAVQSRLF